MKRGKGLPGRKTDTARTSRFTEKILRPLVRVGKDTGSLFVRNQLSRTAAALSFFLTLSIFPFLICLNWLVGMLPFDFSSFIHGVGAFMPKDTVEILNDYLSYISGSQSTPMLIAGILLMATSSSSAFRIVLHSMEHIYRQKQQKGIWSYLFSFVYSFVFLFSIYICIILVGTGKWFLDLLETHLHWNGLSNNWLWSRFLLLFLFTLLVVYCLYRFAVPLKKRKVQVIKGALFAAAALVVVSLIYSWFIGMSTKYSLVYGSLASIMILMMWLYTCSNILILGASLNVVLTKRKEDPDTTIRLEKGSAKACAGNKNQKVAAKSK